MYRICALTVLFVFFFGNQMSIAQQVADLHGLGHLQATTPDSRAFAVSGNGEVVVGIAYVEQGWHAFRWASGGGMADIGTFEPHAVSHDGSVVVGFTAHPDRSSVRWTPNSGAVYLDTPPGWTPISWAWGVSADGTVIVGAGDIVWGSSLGPPPTTGEAFRWTAATGAVGIGALSGGVVTSSHANAVTPDGSVIVGSSESASGPEAFRWEGGVIVGLGFLPGGLFRSHGLAVSASGDVIVGYGRSASGSLEAFRWCDGTMVGLGDLPGGSFFSFAIDVSADGEIAVGWSNVSFGGSTTRAFVWNTVQGMREVSDVLVNDHCLDLAGWTLTSALGISSDGTTLVGRGRHNGNNEAWRAVIPRLVLPDCNGNGLPDACEVIRSDVAEFVATLLSGGPFNCLFDTNGDGMIDGTDIAGYIDIRVRP